MLTTHSPKAPEKQPEESPQISKNGPNSPADRYGIIDGFMEYCQQHKLFSLRNSFKRNPYTVISLLAITSNKFLENDKIVWDKIFTSGKGSASKMLHFFSATNSSQGIRGTIEKFLNKELQNNKNKCWYQFGFAECLHRVLSDLPLYSNATSGENKNTLAKKNKTTGALNDIVNIIGKAPKNIDKESDDYKEGYNIGQKFGERYLEIQKIFEKELGINFETLQANNSEQQSAESQQTPASSGSKNKRPHSTTSQSTTLVTSNKKRKSEHQSTIAESSPNSSNKINTLLQRLSRTHSNTVKSFNSELAIQNLTLDEAQDLYKKIDDLRAYYLHLYGNFLKARETMSTFLSSLRTQNRHPVISANEEPESEESKATSSQAIYAPAPPPPPPPLPSICNDMTPVYQTTSYRPLSGSQLNKGIEESESSQEWRPQLPAYSQSFIPRFFQTEITGKTWNSDPKSNGANETPVSTLQNSFQDNHATPDEDKEMAEMAQNLTDLWGDTSSKTSISDSQNSLDEKDFELLTKLTVASSK